MKIEPMKEIVGVRLELSVGEAVALIANVRGARDRVADELEVQLVAGGVDPKTGLPVSGMVFNELPDLGEDVAPEDSGRRKPPKPKRAGVKRPCQFCLKLFDPRGLPKHEKACPDRVTQEESPHMLEPFPPRGVSDSRGAG